MGNGLITRKPNRFTQVSNSVLQSEGLSLKAIGLYSKINSYLTIPNFNLYKSYLMIHCKDGETSFKTAWNELKDAGFLIQRKTKDSKGQYFYEYELLDESIFVLND